MFQKVYALLDKYTTGFPFILWSINAFALVIFLIVFRQQPFIEFEKIQYVLLVMFFWFIGSEICKRRNSISYKILGKVDCFFYLAAFGLIFHWTGGLAGGLFFIAFTAAVSSPLFLTMAESLIYMAIFGVTIFFLYFRSESYLITPYHTGSIILLVVYLFITALIIKYFFDKYHSEAYKKMQIEKQYFAQSESNNIIEQSRKDLKMSNFELQKAKKDLQKHVEELEKFKAATVERELVMIKMKKEMDELKRECGK